MSRKGSKPAKCVRRFCQKSPFLRFWPPGRPRAYTKTNILYTKRKINLCGIHIFNHLILYTTQFFTFTRQIGTTGTTGKTGSTSSPSILLSFWRPCRPRACENVDMLYTQNKIILFRIQILTLK